MMLLKEIIFNTKKIFKLIIVGTLSVIFSSTNSIQKYSEQNTPKNIVQKPRYLTPMQLIKPNHSPRIHGSYHQNEQRDLNTQLLSKRLMKIYASSKLKETVEVSINKRLSTDDNKTLPYFDSIKQKTNNDYEYDYLY